MKTKILLSLLVVILSLGCNKDKFQTKPQLRLKSASEVVPVGGNLNFSMEVTDAEGDIQDTLWVQKIVKRCNNSNFTVKYKVPNFTASKNFKADLNVCYSRTTNGGCPVIQGPACNFNDTATFRFWLKDRAGNVSDTIASDPVVILR